MKSNYAQEVVTLLNHGLQWSVIKSMDEKDIQEVISLFARHLKTATEELEEKPSLTPYDIRKTVYGHIG
jgi:hypothetical protein